MQKIVRVRVLGQLWIGLNPELAGDPKLILLHTYWEWTSKIEEKYMTIIIAVILTAYILSITKLESTG